jgi:hypothetical protein
MRLDDEQMRLHAHFHGVLCTIHPERGPDPVPVVYAVNQDGFVGVPVDRVKAKRSARLQREINLEADPRCSLLIEHWETDDWSQLWWVRAELRHVPEPPKSLTDDLGARLERAVRQYAGQPFHRILVLRVLAISGWSGADG